MNKIKITLDKRKIGRPNKPIEYKVVDDCWVCSSHTSNERYIKISWNGIRYYLHRLVYLIYKGDFPVNKVIRHTCDNTKCINPNHLLVGSIKDNAQDMVKRRRNKTGVNKSSNKLSDDEVIAIYCDRSFGPRILSRWLGIAHTTIIRIRQGKKWRRLLCDVGVIPNA